MSRRRPLAWGAEWDDGGLKYGSFGLTTREETSLNAAIYRINAGHSPFDLHAKVRKHSYAHAHQAAISQIFGRSAYPVRPRIIDHSPN